MHEQGGAHWIHEMKTHNIGGSILPSSCPSILQPMPFRGRVLRVVPDYEADTHHLQLNGVTIASHSNGHSCSALAERMIAGDLKRIRDQAEYIVRCGGRSDLAAINSAMED